jgi:hypothetical protein
VHQFIPKPFENGILWWLLAIKPLSHSDKFEILDGMPDDQLPIS